MAAGKRRRAFPLFWTIAMAVVFLALVASTVRFLVEPHLPARYLDGRRTTLVARGDGTAVLHLVVRGVPREGNLRYDVRGIEEGGPVTVVLDWTAETRQTGRETDLGERILDIPLPDVPRVTVLDHRWGEDQGMVVTRKPARDPLPSR